MCHQSVGLIQAALEREGVATVGVSVCREITTRVGPPRTLLVDRPFGYPLGDAGDGPRQRRIIEAALALLAHPGPGPLLGEFGGENSSGEIE